MSATGTDTLGTWTLPALAANNYDYAEIPLAQVMALDKAEFEEVLIKLNDSGMVCEAMNNFFPAHVKLTGPAVSQTDISEYLDKALERAKRLGAKVIVFGSSGARNVEPDFPMDKAMEQLSRILQLISEKTVPCGINVAIESLNTKESNIINSLTEGAALAKAVNRTNIGVLIDLYHMQMENEGLDVIKRLYTGGTVFMHAHIADTSANRGFPLDGKLFSKFAHTLEEINYTGRLSIEGHTQNFDTEIKQAKETLDSLFGKQGD